MSTKISTSVNIAGVELKNPVMTASGTFGSGAEYSEFVDLSNNFHSDSIFSLNVISRITHQKQQYNPF